MFAQNKIREELIADKKSYADNTPVADENTLDCSLGINPYGFPDNIVEIIKNFDPQHLYEYPHGDEARRAIVEYWENIANIEPENVITTDGSVTALSLLTTVFFNHKGAEMVCFMPTFTEMVEYAKLVGIKVTGIEASAEDDYKLPVDKMIEAITADTNFVYIDNPNNPTGQTLGLDDLRRILEKCEANDVYCIIDEAYADFIPVQESAVNLGPEFKCMISVRTFSKGFGLAGARAGYIITNKELVKIISKISNPYMMNEFTRKLISAVLTNPTQPHAHGIDFSIIKGALRDACGDKIKMMVTDDRVPICLLRHVDESVDLRAYLMEENILTCSGSDFYPLGANCVRLRVPTLAESGKLILAMRKLASK